MYGEVSLPRTGVDNSDALGASRLRRYGVDRDDEKAESRIREMSILVRMSRRFPAGILTWSNSTTLCSVHEVFEAAYWFRENSCDLEYIFIRQKARILHLPLQHSDLRQHRRQILLRHEIQTMARKRLLF